MTSSCNRKSLMIFFTASFTSQSSNQLPLCSTREVISANQERVSFDVTFKRVRGSGPGSGRRVWRVCRNNCCLCCESVFNLIMDSVSGSSSAALAGTVQLKCVCELTAPLMFLYLISICVTLPDVVFTFDVLSGLYMMVQTCKSVINDKNHHNNQLC